MNMIDMGRQIGDIQLRNYSAFEKKRNRNYHREITSWFKNVSELFVKTPLSKQKNKRSHLWLIYIHTSQVIFKLLKFNNCKYRGWVLRVFLVFLYTIGLSCNFFIGIFKLQKTWFLNSFHVVWKLIAGFIKIYSYTAL